MALQLLIDGNDYTSELVHESLSINQTNDGLNSTCSFEIRDADVIGEGIWTVGVTRVEDGDVITGHVVFSEPKVEVSVVEGATVYFAGILSRINLAPSGCVQVGDYIEPRNQVLRCHCHDFNALLEESVIDNLEEYTNKTDEFIIDDIFTKYVTGIDFATFVDGGAFTFRSISFENITVRQALDLIVDRTGYVWYVDYSKKLHYSEEEANAPGWHLSDVPDQINSFSYLDPVSRETDATNLVNMVFVVASTTSTWFIDAASVTSYGEHKAIVRDARLSLTESIAARGNTLLDKFKDPIEIYIVRTYKDDLRAGMHIRFVCAYLDVDETFLINRLRITFPTDGEPLYELTLGGLESSISGAAQRLILDELYTDQPIAASQLPLASRGWGHDLEFTATDADTVEWIAGTLTTAGGYTFNIAAGDTDDPGAMVAKTIVYLDTAISITDLQMTTDELAAIGNNRIMVAVCWPSGVAGVDAGFQVFGASSEGEQTFLNADNIAADCITANEIAANTITAAELAAAYIIVTGAAGDVNANVTTIDGGKITALSVDTGQLAALCITAGKIEALAIDTGHLAADAVTAAKIDVINLQAVSADMGALTAGSITMVGAAGALQIFGGGLSLYDGPNPAADNRILYLSTITGTFDIKSDIAGNPRIEISNSEIVGYDGADVKQFYLSAADGVAYAGGGVVQLDEDGITIDMGGDLENRISFDHAGTERGYIWPKAYATGTFLAINSGPTSNAAHRATININAVPFGGAGTQTGIDIYSPKTATVGYIGFHADGVTSMTLRDEGPRLGIGRHLEFDNALNYLYKDASDDLYWKKDGVAAVKLN